ncbi:YihY/virulence factor BrkB family protein [Nocardiopsis sp. CNT312]|uniref:YihY/virulence factor BrkB family protein n=1 Tax=Nocardiopsis sp. CNT312 TaxID=1137268 RepID=UPI0009DDE9E1|nr:YihY/virulence factor BrkB family protein [Nocardiopsis sp. CNT312]
MPAVVDRGRAAARRYHHMSMDAFWALRHRNAVFDHLVRALGRYAECSGSLLAGAVTYYAFLSFFPLLALAFAAVGFVAAGQAELTSYLEEALDQILPGLSDQLPVEEIANARLGAGLIGVLGLLYSGLNAVSELRQALHRVWLRKVKDSPNFLLGKAIDLLVMLGLGVALLCTVAFTSVAQAATGFLLSLVGLDGSLVANLALRGLALVIAVAANTAIFAMVFRLLSGSGRPLRELWHGALLGAVGFEILKSVAAMLLSGTLSNPLYASFAVLVGLLVWINFVMRIVVLSASWAATWLPVPPPYTAMPEPSDVAG